jgi:plasmid maintenance system antidote protein VapI
MQTPTTWTGELRRQTRLATLLIKDHTMNNPQPFGQWLKARMEETGWTVSALGQLIGRGDVAIFRWRNGSHHPVGRVQAALASALGVPVSEVRQRVFRERRALHAHKTSAPVSA